MAALRLGIIGCGSWSSRMHLPALIRLAGLHDVVCAGVCDRDRQRAGRYAAELAGGIAGPAAPVVFTDAEQMLEACRPDGVLVLVPPPVAADVVKLVARHRVPFLVEKPPAPDTATHLELIHATRGLPHVVAYNRRHAPYVVQAKQWLEGIVPQSVTCCFARYQRREPDFTTTAVHAIDTVRHLAGDDFARVRIEAAPAGGAVSFFLNGWTRRGTRIDILITPDTASAVEHYIVRAAERTVVVAYPQPAMMDVPGFVELQEANLVAQRKGPREFGLEPDEIVTLNGIVGEQMALCEALRGTGRQAASGTQNTAGQVSRGTQDSGRQAASGTQDTGRQAAGGTQSTAGQASCGTQTGGSTLVGTLQTQQVREELSRLLARGGHAATDVEFEANSGARELSKE